MVDCILNLIEISLCLWLEVSEFPRMSRPVLTSLPSINPFTPPSSVSSMDSEARDILEPSLSLEEGLRRSQLRSMQNVNKEFAEVESIYRQIHGEAVSQQGAISSVEESTLKTALLTGETVDELKKSKQTKDRRLRCRLMCVGVFIIALVIWLFLVLGLRRE